MTGRFSAFGGLLLATSLVLTGCLEREVRVEVGPDRQGTVALDVTLKRASILQDRDGWAADQLVVWKGVEAWSDVSVEERGSGYHLSATGWFSDVNRLRSESDLSFRFETEGNESSLRAVGERPAASLQQQLRGLLRSSDRAYTYRKQNSGPMAKRMLHGYRDTVTLQLGEESKRKVTSEEDVRSRIDGMFARTDALRADIAAGKTDAESAADSILAGVAQARGLELEARTPAADPTHAERFATAKRSWSSSPWKARVGKARETREALASLNASLSKPTAATAARATATRSSARATRLKHKASAPDRDERLLSLQSDGRRGQLRWSLDLAVSWEKPSREDIDGWATARLSTWQGVLAWTDVHASHENGRARLKATGWFSDASRIGRSFGDRIDFGTQMRLKVERDGDDLVVSTGDDARQMSGMLRSLLQDERRLNGFLGMIAAKSERFRKSQLEIALERPGAKKPVRLVDLRPGGDPDRFVDALGKLHKRVTAKRIPLGEAVEQALDLCTTQQTVEAPRPDPTFDARLAAARKAWEIRQQGAQGR